MEDEEGGLKLSLSVAHDDHALPFLVVLMGMLDLVCFSTFLPVSFIMINFFILMIG